jgi:hypothetical protein
MVKHFSIDMVMLAFAENYWRAKEGQRRVKRGKGACGLGLAI